MEALIPALGLTAAFTLACGVGPREDQADACAAYLDCLSAVDATALAAAQPAYGADGTCWEDEVSANQCAAACEGEMDDIETLFPDEALCDDGVTELNEVLDGGEWTLTNDGHDGYEHLWVMELTAELTSIVDGFTMVGDVRLEPDYDFELATACETDGRGFTCEPAEMDYGNNTYFYLDLEGEFAEDFESLTATGEMSGEQYGEALPIDSSSELSGSPD